MQVGKRLIRLRTRARTSSAVTSNAHLLFASPSVLTASSFARASTQCEVETFVARRCARHHVHQHQHIAPTKATRTTTRASSLDESKRRARSSYDNIPDLNQQYISELGWVERKYGPKGLKGKDILKEAQRNISVESGRPVSKPKAANQTEWADAQGSSTDITAATTDTSELDLSGYEHIRKRLLGDTLFVGALGLCGVWAMGEVRDVASFAFGVGVGVAYVWLLSRSVDRMSDAARSTGAAMGDPLQAARVALVALAVVGAARNSDRFSVLAVILGFLTYKIASVLPLVTGEAYE